MLLFDQQEERKIHKTATLSDQGVRLSLLSTVSATSGIIFSAVEAKLTSLIEMTIFNNYIQFIIGEEETSRAMLSAARKFQGITSCQGEIRCKGRCLISVLGIISRNSVISYYIIHFQVDGATTKDPPLLNILAGGGSPKCVNSKYCGLYRSNQMWSQEIC